MPMITLYLGNEIIRRFATEADAFRVGAELHTADKPARVEHIPAGGGLIQEWVYDPVVSDWVTSCGNV